MVCDTCVAMNGDFILLLTSVRSAALGNRKKSFAFEKCKQLWKCFSVLFALGTVFILGTVFGFHERVLGT